MNTTRRTPRQQLLMAFELRSWCYTDHGAPTVDEVFEASGMRHSLCQDVLDELVAEMTLCVEDGRIRIYQ